MRDVAIVSTAQYNTASDPERNEIEILLPVAQKQELPVRSPIPLTKPFVPSSPSRLATVTR